MGACRRVPFAPTDHSTLGCYRSHDILWRLYAGEQLKLSYALLRKDLEAMDCYPPLTAHPPNLLEEWRLDRIIRELFKARN